MSDKIEITKKDKNKKNKKDEDMPVPTKKTPPPLSHVSNCYKKRFIIEHTDYLKREQKVSIIRTIYNEDPQYIQECGSGSYIDLNVLDTNIINIIYNIVKSCPA